jgi:hypothetical protein
MIEKMCSMRQAAKLLGISRKNLRDRIESDLGKQLPAVAHGSKILLSKTDIETLSAALAVPRKTVDSLWQGDLSEYIADWHKCRRRHAKKAQP